MKILSSLSLQSNGWLESQKKTTARFTGSRETKDVSPKSGGLHCGWRHPWDDSWKTPWTLPLCVRQRTSAWWKKIGSWKRHDVEVLLGSIYTLQWFIPHRDIEKGFANRLLFQKQPFQSRFHSKRSTTGDICWAKVEVVNHGILSAVHQEMSSIPHLEKPPLEPGRSNEAGAEFGSTFEIIWKHIRKEFERKDISPKWRFLPTRCNFWVFLHILVLFAMLGCSFCP